MKTLDKIVDARHSSDDFEDIYRACIPSVRSALSLYHIPESEKADLTQEIFITLWKALAKFDPNKSPLTAFVYQIAKRRSIDFIRSTERRRNRDTSYENLLKAQSSMYEPDSDQVYSIRDRCQLLHDLIPKICKSQKTRRIIELYAEGHTLYEIAGILNTNPSTIKTSWRRFQKNFLEFHAKKFTT